MTNGRTLAVQLLNQTEQRQSYSNLLLDHALLKSDMEEREKRLCSMLYYGVIERRITLDAVLAHYSQKPIRKLDGTVRNILRLGIYQLLYCDQIPARAAVSESVRLTRTLRKSSASGFVNAVLRNFLRDSCQIPLPEEPLEAMSVQYAAPQWLLEQLTAAYGTEKTCRFLENALEPAPRYIRRNAVKCSREELEEALKGKISPVPLLPDAYILTAGDIRQLPAYQEGWFYVQDLASQICALALGAQPGETILDLCAAPGGKSCTIATQMENRGRVLAFDLAAHRTQLIQENAKRLGLSCVTAAVGDATQFHPELAGADRVLCDVPCSGIGVLRRKPEIREKNPEELKSLPPLQLEILENGARYVRQGGILQYSTCTILPAENETVVKMFLQRHPEFEPVPVCPSLGDTFAAPMVTLLPEICGSDGFFIARLRRR